jgi:hypothetical protein
VALIEAAGKTSHSLKTNRYELIVMPIERTEETELAKARRRKPYPMSAVPQNWRGAMARAGDLATVFERFAGRGAV